METYSTIDETRGWLEEARITGKSVGFVPTMGALHEGHLALMQRAKTENHCCVCSIYVNPTQFNNRQDLEKYPRNLNQDARMLENIGCDLLFTPQTDEIYPHGVQELLDIEFGRLDKVMEGRFRPGHFRGVATVVRKLFDIVKPDRAYFGKKDYQQLAIIREMVRQYQLPVEIMASDTVREPDGLAMSSRNMRLTIAERQVAPVIYQVLQQIKQRAGKKTIRELISWGVKQMEKKPGFSVEYLEIANRYTLQPISTWKEKDEAVVFVAAFLGDVRLIDNLELFS